MLTWRDTAVGIQQQFQLKHYIHVFSLSMEICPDVSSEFMTSPELIPAPCLGQVLGMSLVWLRLVGGKHQRGDKGKAAGQAQRGQPRALGGSAEVWLHQEHLVLVDRHKNSAGLVGNEALLPQGSQELVEMRCSCECWPSLTPVSCSDFRRGGYLQEGLFCMEMSAQGKDKSLTIVTSQGSDGH